MMSNWKGFKLWVVIHFSLLDWKTTSNNLISQYSHWCLMFRLLVLLVPFQFDIIIFKNFPFIIAFSISPLSEISLATRKKKEGKLLQIEINRKVVLLVYCLVTLYLLYLCFFFVCVCVFSYFVTCSVSLICNEKWRKWSRGFQIIKAFLSESSHLHKN